MKPKSLPFFSKTVTRTDQTAYKNLGEVDCDEGNLYYRCLTRAACSSPRITNYLPIEISSLREMAGLEGGLYMASHPLLSTLPSPNTTLPRFHHQLSKNFPVQSWLHYTTPYSGAVQSETSRVKQTGGS